jgi:hypothetical protein
MRGIIVMILESWTGGLDWIGVTRAEVPESAIRGITNVEGRGWIAPGVSDITSESLMNEVHDPCAASEGVDCGFKIPAEP